MEKRHEENSDTMAKQNDPFIDDFFERLRTGLDSLIRKN